MAPFHYFAHRGLHQIEKGIPENSIEAFEQAVAHEVGIELDVQLSKDQEVVVFHDFSLKRMTGVEALVKDKTLAELQELSLQGTNSKIPTFQEVLNIVGGKVPLLVEIKNESMPGTLEKKVTDMLLAYQGVYWVESFDPLSIMWVKHHYPEMVVGQLSSQAVKTIKGIILGFISNPNVLQHMVKPDFVAYRLEDATKETKQEFHGLPLLLWTVHNEAEEKSAKEIADGIIFEGYVPKR